MARPLSITVREPIIEELVDRLIKKTQNKTHQELADEFGVSHPTIGNYLREAYKRIPKKSIEQRMHEIAEDFEWIKSTNAVHARRAMQDPKLFKELSDHHMKIIEKETDFLERFHIKTKAQENIKLEVEKQLVVDVFDEPIQDTKAKEIEVEE